VGRGVRGRGHPPARGGAGGFPAPAGGGGPRCRGVVRLRGGGAGPGGFLRGGLPPFPAPPVLVAVGDQPRRPAVLVDPAGRRGRELRRPGDLLPAGPPRTAAPLAGGVPAVGRPGRRDVLQPRRELLGPPLPRRPGLLRAAPA